MKIDSESHQSETCFSVACEENSEQESFNKFVVITREEE